MWGPVLKGVAAVLWPLLVAGALWAFRIEVKALLARLRRVGTKGAEFDESRLAAQIAAMPVAQALKEVAPQETHPPSIVERVTILRSELATLHQNSDANRIGLLLLRLAEAQQVVDLQFIWLNIFASQLEALEGMRASGAVADLGPYYEAHQQRYSTFAASRDNPVPPVNFEGWVSFLVRNAVAEISGKAGKITDKGTHLLMLAAGRNLPRFHIF